MSSTLVQSIPRRDGTVGNCLTHAPGGIPPCGTLNEVPSSKGNAVQSQLNPGIDPSRAKLVTCTAYLRVVK